MIVLSKVLLVCAFLVLILNGCSSLQMQQQTETIGPSKIHEDCVELTVNSTLNFSFKASSPVDFNIHYHEGKDIHYPLRKDKVSEFEGTFSPSKDQFYCFMWTNIQSETVTLVYSYKVEKK